MACTTILVGKNASYDGSTMIARNDDSGSGHFTAKKWTVIHPEDLPHLFKRFYRSRFAQDTPGIGLGLPLAKSIVEVHGGTLEVESELGRGTAFTILLRNRPAPAIPTKL